MDTRKLSAHIDHDHGGRIETDGWGISASVDHAEDPEMIRELVRRWNAFPELVAMLKEFVGSDGYGEGDMEDLRNEAHQLLNTLNQ